LQEAGRWDRGIMTAIDYGAYPIQDFLATPAMVSTVIDRPDQPSLGAGEGSPGPAGAAIANAVFAATGRRVAEVPLTPERVLAALRA
jgi:nicotinate dehydrogenase subunit B